MGTKRGRPATLGVTRDGVVLRVRIAPADLAGLRREAGPGGVSELVRRLIRRLLDGEIALPVERGED